MKNNKKLGVVIAVDGLEAQIGMYNLTNDDVILWNGEMVVGPKIGAYLSINQNGIKIIASVTEEKVIDQQNTVRSIEFDNRYSKNSINRIVKLKTKGVIENDRFFVTSQYVPMIGNEVTTISSKEMNIIYSQYNEHNSIKIGESILEKYPVKIDINKFFASHVGIFGNTGSGKSNTLHKLYLELFRTNYYDKIKEYSQFYVIDFNGEYVDENSFEIESEKKIYEINTKDSSSDKIPILEKYLFDADILSILFDARPATQVPFLRKAIKKWNEMKDNNQKGSFVVGTLKKILTTGDSENSEAMVNWISVSKICVEEGLFSKLEELKYHSRNKSYYLEEEQIYINDKSSLDIEVIKVLNIDKIEEAINKVFNESDKIKQLKLFLLFQKVHQSSWKSTNIEHINPLFNRIESSFNSLEKVVSVIEDSSSNFENYKTLNIISLVHANQEIKRLIPMLFSKMIYDEQKNSVAGKDVKITKHLIIDEAHNILNSTFRNIGDDWQDYRLSVFEEIIKEGRKFGFYLTLASQRPADISPTILSQVHNYIIHRLVNEKDLRMLENTMPTLDKNSYRMIPCLGQGEAIITGNSISIPIFVKVDKENKLHPTSEDVVLTDIWK